MKYIEIRRGDCAGAYTVPREELASVMDGEFDDLADMPVGTSIALVVVVMSQKEYDALPEFAGW